MLPHVKIRQRLPALFALGVATSLGACAAGEGFSLSNFNAPKFEVRPLETNTTFSGAGPLRPVTPDQLINSDGSCAAPAQAPAGGVGLGMTECEVVSRAGAPGNVEVTANESQQRALVLTYNQGTRPVIYRFVAGRLRVIEGTPEPPAPPKPVKQARKKAKKRAAASPPPQ